MDNKFKPGNRVMFIGTFRFRSGSYSVEIDTGDLGTVCEPKYPNSDWVVTVKLDGHDGQTVTVPSDIVELFPEKKNECRCDCECACGDEEDLTTLPGFILLHDDATGEAVMYRASIINAIGDGYVVLEDGTEFDCEESIEDIAKQISREIEDGWA